VTVFAGLYNRFDLRNGESILARAHAPHDPGGNWGQEQERTDI
jgi:hypothetical protein